MEAITGRVRHLDVKSVSSAARCRLEYGMGKHPGGQAIEDLVGLALAARELALVQTPHGSNASRSPASSAGDRMICDYAMDDRDLQTFA